MVLGNVFDFLSNYLQIGGSAGPRINNSSGTIEAKNAAGNALVNINCAIASAANHAATYENVIYTGIAVAFHFDGATPPAANDNAGKFGLCGKTGGSYTAGDIIYDNGTTLVVVPTRIGQSVTTTVAVSGAGYTVTMSDKYLYAIESISPNTFEHKTNGAVTGGFASVIAIPFTTSSVNSTTQIATSGVVIKTSVVFDTPLNAGTLAVACNAQSLMATTENEATVAEEYQVVKSTGISAAAVIAVTIAGGPVSGAGTVYVEYVNAPLT